MKPPGRPKGILRLSAEGWPSEARRGSAVRLRACDIVARVKRDVEPLQAAAGAAPIPDRAAAAPPRLRPGGKVTADADLPHIAACAVRR